MYGLAHVDQAPSTEHCKAILFSQFSSGRLGALRGVQLEIPGVAEREGDGLPAPSVGEVGTGTVLTDFVLTVEVNNCRGSHCKALAGSTRRNSP